MDQIDKVRQKTDIVDLIGSYISLKKAGRNFKALCPFHSENTPSFVVSPELQIWKCFGCGKGGDVFRFLMEYEGMEFGEALRFLAKKAGIKLKSYKPSKKYQQKDVLLKINHLALEYYHYILLNHQVGKKGLNYLLDRGIKKSSIKKFKIGYAPQGWDNLQSFLVDKKNYKKEDLEKTGLVIQGKHSYYDRFRGRIIFPLHNHYNNVVGFSGRVLEKVKSAKYVNTPETLLYHKSNLLYGLNWTKKKIKEKDFAVIVEGELDMISSYQAGVKNVIAIKGTALTKQQVDLIKRFTENVYLALDQDAAGDSAVKRGIEMADQAGLNIRVIVVKYGKDPDECAQHSSKLWRESVKQSIPIYDFYLQTAESKYEIDSAQGKKSFSEEIIPVLAKIANQVVRSHYLKKTAEILDVQEEVILAEIERWQRMNQDDYRNYSQHKEEEKKEEPRTRQERIEEFLLSLVLQARSSRKKLIETIEFDWVKMNAVKRILKELEDFLKDQGKFSASSFIEKLPGELQDKANTLYLQDLQIDLEDDKNFQYQFEKTVKELKILFLRGKVKNLAEKIKKLEDENKQDKLQKFKKKFIEASQKLKDLV